MIASQPGGIDWNLRIRAEGPQHGLYCTGLVLSSADKSWKINANVRSYHTPYGQQTGRHWGHVCFV